MATDITANVSVENNLGLIVAVNKGTIKDNIFLIAKPERDECLNDLHLTNPFDDKERIKGDTGGLLEGSYRWVLDHPDYRRWRDDDQIRLLWIKGDPGKGKTMLLIGLVDELEQLPVQSKQAGQSTSHTTVLSYFFCQATDSNLNNATAVLRGLVYLLAIQQPSLASHLRKKYEQSGNKLFEGANTYFALSDILSGMLQDPSLERAYIVIDALDECETGLQQLLKFIAANMSASRVKWIVSSRNKHDIEEKLDNAKQKVTLDLESNQDSISRAVDTYIGYKVDQLAHDKKYDKETRQAVENHLISNADGTFLWVALVCQELASRDVRAWHTRDLLKPFTPGLNSLYDRMMEHVSDSRDASCCKEVLAVVSMVYRPITLDELKVLATLVDSISKDHLEGIVGSCGSFLTLRGGVIRFVHKSAKDFLVNKASDQILPLGARHRHHAIFSRSLRALSETLRRDIYGLSTPGFSIDQVSPPDPDPLSTVRYSCIYWVDHLHGSGSTEVNNILQDNSDVHGFIQKKYLYWLESLSLLHSMSEGVKAVHKLESLLRNAGVGQLTTQDHTNTHKFTQKCLYRLESLSLLPSTWKRAKAVRELESLPRNAGARQLTKLLRDAHRFILAHRRPIEIAPLQAYTSALVFSPEHSLIRELFKKEEPDWMISKPRMESVWNACLQTLEGHGSSVWSVALSADGQRVASGSRNGTVKIWDAATGACMQTLEGHSDGVSSVALSANGQRVASGSHDRIVKIWDAATGTCMQTLKGHRYEVLSVALSADGQRVASGSHDGTVKIWDAATGTCVQTLEGHSGWVLSVALSADGQRVASGSRDKTVKIWDAATGTCVQTLEGHSGWVLSVALSANGQRVASGSKTVKIWDAATGTCVQTLEGHRDGVSSVALSADGQRVASGSRDKTVKIWDAATGAYMQILEGHGDEVSSVALSADGQRVVSGSRDKTVKIWDAATGAYMQTLKGHRDEVSSVALSADGQWVASGSHDKTVKIWDAATGTCVQTLKGHRDGVSSVALSADGQRVASGSGSRDGTVKIWDAATGACVQTLNVGRTLYRLSFDPMTNSRLSTDIGLLNLELPNQTPAIDAQSTEEAILQRASHSGYGISTDGVWVVKDGMNMLWLPSGYRPVRLAVVGLTVAIGCASGRVLVMKFS